MFASAYEGETSKVDCFSNVRIPQKLWRKNDRDSSSSSISFGVLLFQYCHSLLSRAYLCHTRVHLLNRDCRYCLSCIVIRVSDYQPCLHTLCLSQLNVRVNLSCEFNQYIVISTAWISCNMSVNYSIVACIITRKKWVDWSPGYLWSVCWGLSADKIFIMH